MDDFTHDAQSVDVSRDSILDSILDVISMADYVGRLTVNLSPGVFDLIVIHIHPYVLFQLPRKPSTIVLK